MGKLGRNRRHTPKEPRPAVVLPAALSLDKPPSEATVVKALAAAESNPCLGQPAGTPCMTWKNPDGSTTVCVCDGRGNCITPR